QISCLRQLILADQWRYRASEDTKKLFEGRTKIDILNLSNLFPNYYRTKKNTLRLFMLINV
ncbi:MAG: hypothetical protein WAU25_00155, partial [Nitrososphaeraceae archaeon]